MAKWGVLIVFVLFIISACSSKDTTETGNLDEWKTKILQDTDSEASKTLAECEAALSNSVTTCSDHDGWRVVNVMEITDFKTDNPYNFQDLQGDGCPETPPITAETATIITGSDSSYQVACNIVCNWWECTEKTDDPTDNTGGTDKLTGPETWTGTITAQYEDFGDSCTGAVVSIEYQLTLNSPVSLVSALNGQQEITLWSEPGYKETSGTIQGTTTVDIQPPRDGVIYCELEDGESEDVPITFFATGGEDQKIQLSEPPGSNQNIRTPRFGHKYYYHEEVGLTEDSPLVGFPPILDPESITDTEITGSLRAGFSYEGTFELRKS